MIFEKLPGAVDIGELAVQLRAREDLWDLNTRRTEDPRSPHSGCSDIWLRYNDPARLSIDYVAWTQEHDSVWHPAAAELPALADIVFDTMRAVRATRLGGCLITRIPPGKSVRPHADTGWHPRYYNTKVYIPLQSPAECLNYCDGVCVHMKAGEAWVMNNTLTHSVVNGGDIDRITLIVSTKTEP